VRQAAVVDSIERASGAIASSRRSLASD